MISVIIVNYNNKESVLQCLRSLYADLGDMAAEVWVVDNASSDDSVEGIQKNFPQVNIIENGRNVGFGVANNQAMRQARWKFFLLLNNDAFLRQGAIAAMVKYMSEHPKVGVVGPRLVYSDGRMQRSCWRFPSPLRAWLEALGISAAFPNHPILGDYYRWPHDKERLVDFVIGACMLVRRKAYEEVGGFDENIFMFSEETDWQRRIGDKGWQIAFVPSAEAVHLGGATMPYETPKRMELSLRSLDYYMMKHHGVAGLISARFAMAVGSSIRIIVGSLLMLAGKKRIGYLKLQLYMLLRQLTYWKTGTRHNRFLRVLE